MKRCNALVNNMLRGVFLLSLLLLSATACVPILQTKPDISPESLFATRSKELVQLDRWKIKGRTMITQGSEAWSVGLRWQEDRGAYQIKLEGPFAQGGVTLDGDEEQVVLTMTTGEKIASTNPEELILEVVGWNLPVSALRDWVRGLPYEQQAIESITYDDEGRITHLVQQGWDIEFLRYMPFDSYSMPAKIFIKHPDLSVRLVISSWNNVK